MQDNEKNINSEEAKEVPVYTLRDEESGEEQDFALLAEAEIEDKYYFALEPVGDNESGEYVILRVEGDGEDMTLETIDDDDEFERAEDFFNDLLFEVDYDEKED